MSTKPTRWLADKFGRRGAALVIVGSAFMALGADYALHDDEHFILHMEVSALVHALLWAVPGAIAVVAAFTRRKGDHGQIGVGFGALTIPLIITIFDLAVSGAAAILGYGEHHGGLVGALPWAFLLALILLIAGWPEVCPPRPPRRRWRKGGDP